MHKRASERSRFALAVAATLASGCGITVTPAPEEQVSSAAPSQPGAQEVAATYVSPTPAFPNGVVLSAWNAAITGFLAIGASTTPGTWGSWCSIQTCNSGGQVSTAVHQDTFPGSSIPSYRGDPSIAAADGAGAFATGAVLATNISSSTVRGTCTSACPCASCPGGMGTAECVTTGILPPGATVGCRHPGDAVVALASFDSGVTWGATQQQTLIVNEGTGPCDIQAPTQFGPSSWNGVDRPHVAYMGDVPSDFFVEWSSDQYLCVRRVFATPQHTLSSPGPTAVIASGFPGDAMIRARGGIVWVMFADQFTIGCGPTTMNYTMATSTDLGATWTNHAVGGPTSFDPCFAGIGGTTNAGSIFSFDVAADGTLYAAVVDTTTRGTTMRILHSVNGDTWTTVDYPATGGRETAQPWVTADRLGNVAVSFYEVDTSGAQITRMVVLRDGSVGSWTLPTALSLPFTPNPSAGFTDAVIGEYQGGTLIDPIFSPGNSFFSVWTEADPSVSGATTRIEGARIGVTP